MRPNATSTPLSIMTTNAPTPHGTWTRPGQATRHFLPAMAAALMLGLSLPGSAHAALISYESFGVGPGPNEYTDGASIDGEGHGTGWTTNWGQLVTATTQYTTDTGSIAPSILQSEDGMLVRSATSDSELISRTYGTTVGGVGSSETWFSFAFRRQNNQRFLNISPLANSFSSGGQYWGLVVDNGSSDLYGQVRYAGSTTTNSTDTFSVALGTDYFVVGQLEFNPVAADVMNVWLMPSASFDGTLPMTPTITLSQATDETYDKWNINSQNPQNAVESLIFDELRVGTTFGDVAPIPEPSTAAMLLGALGVLALAKRRRS